MNGFDEVGLGALKLAELRKRQTPSKECLEPVSKRSYSLQWMAMEYFHVLPIAEKHFVAVNDDAFEVAKVELTRRFIELARQSYGFHLRALIFFRRENKSIHQITHFLEFVITEETVGGRARPRKSRTPLCTASF